MYWPIGETNTLLLMTVLLGAQECGLSWRRVFPLGMASPDSSRDSSSLIVPPLIRD
jgi:hypothetical protein